MSTNRANPFADIDSLPAFGTKSKAPTSVPREQTERIEQIAEANNFPSRQPARTPAARTAAKQRRYKTGRNQQINIKATSQVIERLYKMADAKRVPLGELLEQALAALEKSAGVRDE
jgi:hypothetical protein